MQCSQVKIKFSRRLRCEEQEKLIGHFKGLIVSIKETLAKKSKGLDTAAYIGAKIGNDSIGVVQGRIQALLIETTNEKGEKTCIFDKMFSLDWEEANPTEWSFIYPNVQSVLGMGYISKELKKRKIDLNFEDTAMVKGLLNEAGLMRLVEKIEGGTVEE